MKNHSWPSLLALLLTLLLLLQTSWAQQPQPSPPRPAPAQPQQRQQPAKADEEEVVRITTNLVQVDAVVTDKSGRLVTDLGPEDFEVTEDGRPQKVTNFSFVALGPAEGAAKPTANAAAPADRNAPPVPPARLRPDQIRRTIALVVDDLGLSFESTHFVRRALKKFVDEQMQPGDLVAIIRTAGGMGALQQFTADKRQLYAAIERVRWYPVGRGGVSTFAPLEADPLAGAGLSGSAPIPPAEDPESFREEIFTVGTLGALNYIVRGLRELPGRKSVLLISDGIRIFNRDNPARSQRILESLQRLTDLANRASVVIYTMDARGLPTLGLTAADSTSGMTINQLSQSLNNRRADFFETQNGLNYLAQRTGGIAIRNSNDLSAGVRRVLEDQRGYYLIGYRPDESTFDARTGRRTFHKLGIKVKRPGLNVRYRNGFYGVTDEQARPARTREQQLFGALTSPFGATGVHLQLTSLFANDAKAGSFMRSILHIDARDLTFTTEADGQRKVVFDVIAMTFGDNGQVLDQVGRTYTLGMKEEVYKRALETGFNYVMTVPVKKPGAYQLRAALRDTATERTGSASQFIEVPNLSKNRLALSGLTLGGYDLAALKKRQAEQGAQQEQEGAGAQDTDPQSGPAVRRMRHGMLLQYGYVIYNAQADRATGQPQLLTQMRLFRDGREVFTGKQNPYDPKGQADPKRLVATGAIQLGTDMAPGEYVLQIIVTDALAKDKYRTATQWVDFEIVR
ncbi:MAG TPA: VWA domain-containing protein [Pyrinomonadaceae bacterium]|jgi:VWFA-related protein